MRTNVFHRKGQSLVEILIALGISATLIGVAVSAYVVSLRANVSTRLSAVGVQLAQEMYSNLKAFAEAHWPVVYSASKGVSQHLIPDEGYISFAIVPGAETIEVDGTQYTRSFIIENVQRGIGGDIVSSGGHDDPSTQRVIVTVSWPIFGDTGEIKTSGHITRSRNISLSSTTWIDGPGNEGPLMGQTSGFSSSSNIDHLTLPGVIRILNF